MSLYVLPERADKRAAYYMRTSQIPKPAPYCYACVKGGANAGTHWSCVQASRIPANTTSVRPVRCTECAAII